MDFLEAIEYLKEAPKPCKLVFRRLMADPMAVRPVQPKVKSAIGLKLAAKFEELTAAENEKFPPQPAVKLEAKYEIKWIDGPLGISLIASKDVPYPLVTRITGKNRSPQVQDVQPGHYLVQIGSYNTADGNFNTAIKFLQRCRSPCRFSSVQATRRFRRVRSRLRTSTTTFGRRSSRCASLCGRMLPGTWWWRTWAAPSR